MRPTESFVGQPIRSLQTMLRVIAENDPTHVRLVPDGIYGPETTRAVSVFQRNHGLPVTGVTNQATWEAVVAVYEPALVAQTEAQELAIVLNPHIIYIKQRYTGCLSLFTKNPMPLAVFTQSIRRSRNIYQHIYSLTG